MLWVQAGKESNMPSDSPFVSPALGDWLREQRRTPATSSGLALEMTKGTQFNPWMVYWLQGSICPPWLHSRSGGLSFPVGKVMFPHIPRNAYCFLSNFSAAHTKAALPPSNTLKVLGTLIPLSSHCKERVPTWPPSLLLPVPSRGVLSLQSRSEFPQCF